MNEALLPERTERIVVALDASPQSVAALKAAVELAALMEAELEGLFIEDINLLNLCNLPFGREIGSYTASMRRLDNAGMERQLRVLAAAIQQAMARAAAQTSVRWHFEVRRGPVVPELLAAAQSAALLSLGRAGQVRRKSLGSTAQSIVSKSDRPLLILGEGSGLEYPLTVVYTGSPASQRALNLALRLARNDRHALRVLVWAGEQDDIDLVQLQTEAEGLLEAAHAHATFHTMRRAATLLATLRTRDGGTLVLPGEHAALLSEHSGPALLVP
jgi:nucleotide-binding universal stress UspA family protein